MPPAWLLLSLFLVDAAIPIAGAANYTSTCAQVAKSLSPSSQVYYPGSSEYSSDIHHAFSSSTQNSSCTIRPGTPEDVGKALVAITKTRTPWAVKSGGHTSNPGFSSTPGIHISLANFNSTTYDATSGIASVGTGQIWGEVFQKLEPYNVSVAGGRSAEVGVGGFTLGGGFSWISNQVGLACDTVTEFQLVLPTGKVVNVDSNSYPDLFFGLKGGQNNFGIVTNIKYRAHQQSAVYGGLTSVTSAGFPALHQAVANFQSRVQDPKASIGVDYVYTTQFGVLATLITYYDGPSPPSGIFEELVAVPSVSNQSLTASLTTIVSLLSAPAAPPRSLWRSVSLKNYTVPLLDHIAQQTDFWGAQAFKRSALTVVFAVEPLLNSIFQHQNGPSAYFRDPNNPLFPSPMWATWTSPRDDDWMDSMLKSFDQNVTSFAESLAGGTQKIGPPEGILYPNYASYDTPSTLLYGSNVPKLRQIAAKYDPLGLNKLTGGWKF